MIPNSVRFRQVVSGIVQIQINKNKFIVSLSDKLYNQKYVKAKKQKRWAKRNNTIWCWFPERLAKLYSITALNTHQQINVGSGFL